MQDAVDIVVIKLLDREYQIKCPPEKVTDLQEAANYLDLKMRETFGNCNVINHERIFMIAALNITNELIALQKQKNLYIDTMNQQILTLRDKIDQALSG